MDEIQELRQSIINLTSVVQKLFNAQAEINITHAEILEDYKQTRQVIIENLSSIWARLDNDNE